MKDLKYRYIATYKLLTVLILMIPGASLLLLPRLNSHAVLTVVQQNVATGDWVHYMYSNDHQGNNPHETKLSAANAASLTLTETFTGTDRFVGEPIVVNGVIYAGAWDGNMFAFDQATGSVKWETPLGVYGTEKCPARGITSTAAIGNGAIYIGAGPNMYALSPSTGAILWTTPLGPTNDTFIYGAPTFANGKVYVGTASNCDNPLTQGMLFALQPSTGAIVAQAAMVPNGSLGGGIWNAPTIDVVTGTVIVATGSTDNGKLIPMTVSVVTLDWNTLAVKQFWQVPRSQIVADADFGCAPTLFPGPTGKTYFGCINKSSIYYVFDEANVSAGPIWEVQLGPGGEKGGINGSVASSAYVNGVLYIPTALATIDEQSFGGSIGAFDALTGQTLWRFGTAAPIVGSVITANGLLFDSQGHTFEVRDQLTGTVLYSFTAGIIKGSVTVLQGVVYIPDFDHHIYALTVH